MRKYEQVPPEVAGSVGVSKSAVSRRFIEASATQLATLNERPLAEAALLAIYIDGIIVDGTHILAALGVDEQAREAMLGLSAGSSENAQQAEHADAAASMLEGLDEVFTVNKLGLPPSLMRCLCTTNIIENPNGIVPTTTNRVTRWRDQDMAWRWVAGGFLESEKSFRRIDGVKDLWVLAFALGRELPPRCVKRAA